MNLGGLCKLSDWFLSTRSEGKCKIEDVAEGDSVCLGLLNPDNCFIVDVVKHVFVWVGGRASQKEKQNGLGYAHNYLKGKDITEI